MFCAQQNLVLIQSIQMLEAGFTSKIILQHLHENLLPFPSC